MAGAVARTVARIDTTEIVAAMERVAGEIGPVIGTKTGIGIGTETETGTETGAETGTGTGTVVEIEIAIGIRTEAVIGEDETNWWR